MHPAARDFVSVVAGDIGLRQRVVEIGGRNVNGGVREFFPGAQYICTDIEDGVGVDVVADGAEYDPPWPPDTVICCETLEHTPRGREVIANAHRMLAPGGILIVTAAAPPREVHSGWDGGPWLFEGEHYANVTPEALAEWLAVFEDTPGVVRVKVEYDPDAGDVRAVAVKAQPVGPAVPIIDWTEVAV